MDVRTADNLRTKLLGLSASDKSLHEALQGLLQNQKTRESEQELSRLLRLVAPLVRRNALEAGRPDVTAAGVPICILREYFCWLDEHDPIGASILDLRYFACLSVRRIAAMLELTPTAILRQLRLHKYRLRLRQ